MCRQELRRSQLSMQGRIMRFAVNHCTFGLSRPPTMSFSLAPCTCRHIEPSSTSAQDEQIALRSQITCRQSGRIVCVDVVLASRRTLVVAITNLVMQRDLAARVLVAENDWTKHNIQHYLHLNVRLHGSCGRSFGCSRHASTCGALFNANVSSCPCKVERSATSTRVT